MLKAQMIKKLKEIGITKLDGKKLNSLKTYKIGQIYDKHFSQDTYSDLAKMFFE